MVATGVNSLRAVHQSQLRRWRLLFEVLREAEDQVRYAGAALALRPDVVYASLLLRWAISQQVPTDQMPSVDEVAAALRFLASPPVGALTEVPGATDTLRLSMTLATARRRLAQMARVFDEAAAAVRSQGAALQPQHVVHGRCVRFGLLPRIALIRSRHPATERHGRPTASLHSQGRPIRGVVGRAPATSEPAGALVRAVGGPRPSMRSRSSG